MASRREASLYTWLAKRRQAGLRQLTGMRRMETNARTLGKVSRANATRGRGRAPALLRGEGPHSRPDCRSPGRSTRTASRTPRGGALAYGQNGIPRATNDVDVNVFVEVCLQPPPER